MKTRGFTLIELLVVIVILGILITLGSKSLRAAKISAKKAQAAVEMKSIETAVLSYFAKYGRLPSAEFSDDIEMETESADHTGVISALTMAEEDDELNPAAIVFLDPQSGSNPFTYMDPWGYEYVIGLDTGYDGELTALDGTLLRRKVAVASVGLYEISGNSDTNDYITSWQ
jgi:prepilin-type N-terminal cleavage/methylation domain-containing protein